MMSFQCETTLMIIIGLVSGSFTKLKCGALVRYADMSCQVYLNYDHNEFNSNYFWSNKEK